ncbi:MAG: glucosaminidase domain-containing protein [Prevotella nanceiensis]|uniref:glucosaminidase domain-containing protein n=1 Tax=Hoylesella nanceiensis TaxID=425941 RepID=UPI001CADB922|nr:glucosaminidase domain-containing protein [Hoylesella nanceiensis]MBF1442031.1 glucosaminidase domain-containing protein [Hoylesella nanceiensis]
MLIALMLCPINLLGQAKWNVTYQTYIDQYKDIAIEEMLRYNIPASITLAQGLFESAAGQSRLALYSNNHFGIKCHDWTGRSVRHDDDELQECFRAYDNVRQSYEDHSKFLVNKPRYRSLFSLPRTDYRGWARGLKAAGYATNPQYANKLIEIIELYKLYQYDTANSFDKFMVKRSEVDKPTVKGGTLHPIYAYNDNYYLRVRAGDTFKSIAAEVHISARKLAKYNERDKHDPLVEGEVIYLKKKKSRAEKQFKDRPHIVKPGESMYSIAQQYGIKVESLYIKNHLLPDYDIKVDDRLRVY